MQFAQSSTTFHATFRLRNQQQRSSSNLHIAPRKQYKESFDRVENSLQSYLCRLSMSYCQTEWAALSDVHQLMQSVVPVYVTSLTAQLVCQSVFVCSCAMGNTNCHVNGLQCHTVVHSSSRTHTACLTVCLAVHRVTRSDDTPI
jgi:hypothetical protein